MQSKAKFLLTRLRSLDVILFAHYLVDLLHILAKLSRQLQERCMAVFEAHHHIETTMEQIIKFESRYTV